MILDGPFSITPSVTVSVVSPTLLPSIKHLSPSGQWLTCDVHAHKDHTLRMVPEPVFQSCYVHVVTFCGLSCNPQGLLVLSSSSEGRTGTRKICKKLLASSLVNQDLGE